MSIKIDGRVWVVWERRQGWEPRFLMAFASLTDAEKYRNLITTGTAQPGRTIEIDDCDVNLGRGTPNDLTAARPIGSVG